MAHQCRDLTLQTCLNSMSIWICSCLNNNSLTLHNWAQVPVLHLDIQVYYCQSQHQQIHGIVPVFRVLFRAHIRVGLKISTMVSQGVKSLNKTVRWWREWLQCDSVRWWDKREEGTVCMHKAHKWTRAAKHRVKIRSQIAVEIHTTVQKISSSEHAAQTRSPSHYNTVHIANANCPRPDLDFEECLADVGMLEADSGAK